MKQIVHCRGIDPGTFQISPECRLAMALHQL